MALIINFPLPFQQESERNETKSGPHPMRIRRHKSSQKTFTLFIHHFQAKDKMRMLSFDDKKKRYESHLTNESEKQKRKRENKERHFHASNDMFISH